VIRKEKKRGAYNCALKKKNRQITGMKKEKQSERKRKWSTHRKESSMRGNTDPRCLMLPSSLGFIKLIYPQLSSAPLL
jgi:hypothetical protein